jgi:hypothetical protein
MIESAPFSRCDDLRCTGGYGASRCGPTDKDAKVRKSQNAVKKQAAPVLEEKPVLHDLAESDVKRRRRSHRKRNRQRPAMHSRRLKR